MIMIRFINELHCYNILIVNIVLVFINTLSSIFKPGKSKKNLPQSNVSIVLIAHFVFFEVTHDWSDFKP